MSILFINGSPNKNGNTVALSEQFLKGKNMYFIFQGYAPTKQQLEAGEYTMQRFANLYGMNYRGMITE